MRYSERRIFERVRCNFPLEVFERDTGENRKARGYDFSLGGMGILAKRYLPEGKGVELKIKLSVGRQPLRSEGRIVWAHQEASGYWRMGVAFSSWDFFRVLPLMVYRHKNLNSKERI